MAKESVETLVEGGKATAAPPLGPALGPLGVNIGQVVMEINKKTAEFRGMRVPVKITVEKGTKEFTITVGTPPTAELVKKEAHIEKGSANPLLDKVADLRIEQIIKIAKMKQDSLLGKDLTAKIKEIIGTCDSMGILVEGKQARETIKDITGGKFADKIKAEKTELTAEELKVLDEERKRLEIELLERRKELESRAKAIIESMKEKPASAIKLKLREAKIPELLIKELIAEEKKSAEAAPAAAAAPAAGGKAPAAAPAAKGGKK